MKRILLIVLMFSGLSSMSQTIEGKWRMVGMKSGKERSLIEIYEQDGLYYGKVLKVYTKPGAIENPVCDKCKDERKDRPIVGMNIVTDLEYNGRSGEYRGGKILDPETGSEYDCKAWLGKDGFLRIRGYLLFIGKTYVLPKYVE